VYIPQLTLTQYGLAPQAPVGLTFPGLSCFLGWLKKLG